MPDRSSVYASYFKADDVREGARVLTIKSEVVENVAKKDEAPEMKSVLYFAEDERGLALNKSNYDLLSDIFGTKNTDKWIGGRIEIFFDPTIKFAGKKVGGVRVRATNAPVTTSA